MRSQSSSSVVQIQIERGRVRSTRKLFNEMFCPFEVCRRYLHTALAPRWFPVGERGCLGDGV